MPRASMDDPATYRLSVMRQMWRSCRSGPRPAGRRRWHAQTRSEIDARGRMRTAHTIRAKHGVGIELVQARTLPNFVAADGAVGAAQTRQLATATALGRRRGDGGCRCVRHARPDVEGEARFGVRGASTVGTERRLALGLVEAARLGNVVATDGVPYGTHVIDLAAAARLRWRRGRCLGRGCRGCGCARERAEDASLALLVAHPAAQKDATGLQQAALTPRQVVTPALPFRRRRVGRARQELAAALLLLGSSRVAGTDGEDQ